MEHLILNAISDTAPLTKKTVSKLRLWWRYWLDLLKKTVAILWQWLDLQLKKTVSILWHRLDLLNKTVAVLWYWLDLLKKIVAILWPWLDLLKKRIAILWHWQGLLKKTLLSILWHWLYLLKKTVAMALALTRFPEEHSIDTPTLTRFLQEDSYRYSYTDKIFRRRQGCG